MMPPGDLVTRSPSVFTNSERLEVGVVWEQGLVSTPDPNQPQRRLRMMLEAIRAGVGLGLGMRLGHAMMWPSVSPVGLNKLQSRIIV